MTHIKEPLYKKWWAWILLFLITAFIVNATTYDNIDSDYEEGTDSSSELFDDTHSFETEAIPSVALNTNHSATFRIGVQLPAGEYFVLTRDEGLGYILLTRSPQLKATDIIWQRHFENHTIITIRDDEYLTTKNVTLIQIDSAIIPNFEKGVLHAGTYRVGMDIPPGIYTLFPLEGKTGYFSTATTSHQIDAHILQRQNFQEPITVALNEGDYFTMMRAEIRK